MLRQLSKTFQTHASARKTPATAVCEDRIEHTKQSESHWTNTQVFCESRKEKMQYLRPQMHESKSAYTGNAHKKADNVSTQSLRIHIETFGRNTTALEKCS